MAIAFVQSNGANHVKTASTTTSWSVAPTSGNLILLLVVGAGSITGAGAGGSPPTGWTLADDILNNNDTALFYRIADGGANDTPTYVMGGAYNSCWQLAEYSGVDTSTPLDTHATSVPGNATSCSTASTTPTSGDHLLIALIGVSGASATGNYSADFTSWTNSFTHRNSQGFNGAGDDGTNGGGGAGVDALCQGYAERLVTANGSTAYSSGATFPSSNNGYAQTITAAFKAAAGGTTYNDSRTETATTGDSLTNLATFPNTRTETVTTSDSFTSVVTFANSLTETATTGDSDSSQATFANTLTETVTTGDSLSSTLSVQLAETATTGDALTSLATFPNALAEAAVALDTFTFDGTFAGSGQSLGGKRALSRIYDDDDDPAWRPQPLDPADEAALLALLL
jgi:hypothetical protein